MKEKLYSFLWIGLLLFLTACNDALENERMNDAIKTKSQISETTFSFDSITNPMVWKQFNNLEEMQAACQIPEELLSQMSTEQLLQVCMNYPLYGNYVAYNNEMDGIKAVMNGFNGFSELQKREDAAEVLLSFYENMNLDEIANTTTTRSLTSKRTSVLRVGYLEMILSSKLIPALYNDNNRSRLERIRYEKFEAKLRNPNIYSINSVRKSLLIGAQIKLQAATVNGEEKTSLTNFVRMGGNVESPEIYTKISKIINQ